MGISTTAAILISTAVSAAGAMASGAAASKQAKYQAQVAQNQAERARQMGELQASQQRKKNKALEASQRALLGGRGADASTGSALLVGTALGAENELNARLVENNAAAQQTSLQAEAQLQQMRAKNARTSSYFRAGTALMKGGNKLADAGAFDSAPQPYYSNIGL